MATITGLNRPPEPFAWPELSYKVSVDIGKSAGIGPDGNTLASARGPNISEADRAAIQASINAYVHASAATTPAQVAWIDPATGNEFFYLSETDRARLVTAEVPVFASLAAAATAMAFATNTTVKISPSATATYTTTVPPAGSVRYLIVLTSGAVSRTITFGAGFKPTATLATGAVTARVFVVAWISDGVNLYEASRTVALVA